MIGVSTGEWFAAGGFVLAGLGLLYALVGFVRFLLGIVRDPDSEDLFDGKDTE